MFWIGGPAAAGKSTVSRLLARRYGFVWYSVDVNAFVHERRADAAGLHVLGTGPGDFDRGPMIRDDLAGLPFGVSVVVEGAQLTPAMVGGAANALWLMPSLEEQRARLRRRNPEVSHDGMVWGWHLIQGQLEGADVDVLEVDGQSVAETVAAVEARFGAAVRGARGARTVEERRAVIRYGNRRIVEQVAESPKAGAGAGAGVGLRRVFDCECGRAGCGEFVEATVGEARRVVEQEPAGVLTVAGHAVGVGTGAGSGSGAG